MFWYKKGTVVLVLICLLSGLVSNLMAVERGSRKDSLLTDYITRNFLFTPYVAPSYSPELKLLFTAGALMSFKTQPDNPNVSRSSIPFSIGYSTNNSISASILPTIYTKNDRYRILARLFYRNMPDNYWGVGFKEGDRTSKADETTRYHRKWWSLEGKVVRKISNVLFVGLTYDMNATSGSALNDYMKEDVYIKKYGTDVSNFGFGLICEMDKRDNVQNAYEGYLFSFAFADYNTIFNRNGNTFTKVTFDVRKYFSVALRKTLALQLKSMWADGSVPWSELPQLGTTYDLRGYQWGRYRDKAALFSLAEYRHMFTRNKINRKGNYNSPIGFVAWCGLGSVASSYKKIGDWLYNFGVGLRYEIQPRLNARIDYGFGKDNKALYVSISEAF